MLIKKFFIVIFIVSLICHSILGEDGTYTLHRKSSETTDLDEKPVEIKSEDGNMMPSPKKVIWI